MQPSTSTKKFPVEHYQAVAEVIGYVLRLKRRRA